MSVRLRLRLVRSILVGLLLVGAAAAPAVEAGTPLHDAVTWTVDHKAKTITVTIHLEIYSECSADPLNHSPKACAGVSSQVTRFLAQKIQDQIEKAWNGQYYRCYRLIVNVDVSLGSSRSKVSKDKLAVRIDPSFGGIRSFVDNGGNSSDSSDWQSNDPSARVEPTNDGTNVSTWAEAPEAGTETYAHEAGHVMGLDDTYVNIKDAKGNIVDHEAVPGAPKDIMSGYAGISQETMDRLVERNEDRLADKTGNKVALRDLRCDYTLKIKIQMRGANPAFEALIQATGSVDLKPLTGSMPRGTRPIVYEGTGRVNYVVSPLGRAPCTFGYRGKGSFLVGVQRRLKLPLQPSEIVLVIRPRLDPLLKNKDTLIAWPCPTGGGQTQVIALFTEFFADRLGRDWKITSGSRRRASTSSTSPTVPIAVGALDTSATRPTTSSSPRRPSHTPHAGRRRPPKSTKIEATMPSPRITNPVMP